MLNRTPREIVQELDKLALARQTPDTAEASFSFYLPAHKAKWQNNCLLLQHFKSLQGACMILDLQCSCLLCLDS